MTYLAIVAWAVGWVLAIRPALRRRMLTSVCVRCRQRQYCNVRHGGQHGARAARGAISDRNGRDAAAAIWLAAWWPCWLLVMSVAFVVRSIGRGVGAAVLSGRLTGPELERRLREQQAEIMRLSDQIAREG